MALIEDAARELSETGATCIAVQCDISTAEGVRTVAKAIGGRPGDALMANAGRGSGKVFLDEISTKTGCFRRH